MPTADRVEKIDIKRALSATTVTASIVEDGIKVSYTVKTYDSLIDKGVVTAREGAERFLWQAKKGVRTEIQAREM